MARDDEIFGDVGIGALTLVIFQFSGTWSSLHRGKFDSLCFRQNSDFARERLDDPIVHVQKELDRIC
jgi:hypothetical protein